jgi:hypothetical protein
MSTIHENNIADKKSVDMSALSEGERGRDTPKSTIGLDVFDNFLFNGANLAVWGLSVYSTYQSNFTDDKNWFSDRSKEFTSWLQKDNWAHTNKIIQNQQTAKNFNMVAWSFADGLVALPVIAAFKAQRTHIAKAIDNIMGTKPQDESVYENQPQEGLKSVIMGRVVAFCTVMPTFFLLNKKGENGESLNDQMFEKSGNWLNDSNMLGISNFLKKRGFNDNQVSGLINSGVFETFYTTICTLVLFAVSPIIAKLDDHRQQQEEKNWQVKIASKENSEVKPSDDYVTRAKTSKMQYQTAGI